MTIGDTNVAGSTSRRVWELAWPSILSNLLFTTVGFLHIKIVAGLGTSAVAAVTTGHRVFFLIQAILMGLSGADPEEVPITDVPKTVDTIRQSGRLHLGGLRAIPFREQDHLVFLRKFLPFHANALTVEAVSGESQLHRETYYSIGGGFVVTKKQESSKNKDALFETFPCPIHTGEELLAYCHEQERAVSEVVWQNECSLRTPDEILTGLDRIWKTMLDSMYEGCHQPGELPGGLQVRRRAPDLYQNLKGTKEYSNPEEWIRSIRKTRVKFRQILKWVSCFAISVNEVNAALGRIVTAPTNGSAGVVPAVLMYYLVIENHKAGPEHIRKFLMVAGEIGSLFKKGATISAAMGGCQAEIGVSSAMAAAVDCRRWWQGLSN